MYKSFSMELAGRTLTVDVGRVAKQANGAVFMHYGDTVVLSTATASDKPRNQIVQCHIVAVILREQRTHGTVNDSGRQHRILGCFSFPAVKASRNLAH